ncbi:tyrosine phosphatase family protein [Niveomyces insectorum RCEF 264]|uniref:diphosphoinositol-polyphosphate diphosphatase n=1 Tax=Niveomyces insectorum RCEF 264 TaxID=1081102 RepID=A0A167NRM8_9HYPO|nr:tyrosine phosphatase family protein [Niveomyces insectorum RCEF 264]
MVTKRTARSFVEEELVAEDRELQNRCGGIGDSNSNSSNSTSSSSSASARLSVTAVAGTSSDKHDVAVPIEIEPSAVLAGSNSSSRVSISSSSYSSASSTPSDTLLDSANPNFDGEENAIFTPSGAPLNFGNVLPGLYRSSYPRPENFKFLEQLKLKTIVTLVDKNFSKGYRDFMVKNNIEHHIFGMKGTKKEEIPLATMEAILKLVLDRRNYPLLIHCNHGKHRTGCVIAVVRKITGWDNASIAEEYRAYAGRKVRDCDVEYMCGFQLSSISKLLANEGFNLRDIATPSNRANVAIGLPPPAQPPPAAAVGFRVPNFFRATFFSMTVLFIWMISGSKMPPPNRR